MKCSNCGKSVSDGSYYCNNCGFFLSSSKDEIIIKHNKYNELKDFRNLLRKFSNIIENKNGKLCAPFSYEFYTDLVWSYLLDITNIKNFSDFNNMDSSLFLGNLMKTMDNLKDIPKSRIVDEFLHEININYKKHNMQEKVTYRFVFYTNLYFSSPEKRKEFDELLHKFNLKKFSSTFLKFDNNEDEFIINKFNSKFELIEYKITGKNIYEMKQMALNQIYSFLGFLTFGYKSFKSPNKWNINDFSLNHSISDINISSYILLNEDYSFYDLGSSIVIVDNSVKLNKSKLYRDISRISKILNCSDDLSQLYNENFFKDIIEFFKLYYLASIESDLDNSFLKFWFLSEKILKRILGPINDSKLLRMMKKIIKIYDIPKVHVNRLKYIKIKRNYMVHEGISDIDQNDRNIIKLVTDSLILFLIQNFDKVNNVEEYGFLLENWNSDNLNRKIELLEMINKEN